MTRWWMMWLTQQSAISSVHAALGLSVTASVQSICWSQLKCNYLSAVAAVAARWTRWLHWQAVVIDQACWRQLLPFSFRSLTPTDTLSLLQVIDACLEACTLQSGCGCSRSTNSLTSTQSDSTVWWSPITITLSNKYAIKWSLKIPPHSKHVAALRCEILVFKIRTNRKHGNCSEFIGHQTRGDVSRLNYHVRQLRLFHP